MLSLFVFLIVLSSFLHLFLVSLLYLLFSSFFISLSFVSFTLLVFVLCLFLTLIHFSYPSLNFRIRNFFYHTRFLFFSLSTTSPPSIFSVFVIIIMVVIIFTPNVDTVCYCYRCSCYFCCRKISVRVIFIFHFHFIFSAEMEDNLYYSLSEKNKKYSYFTLLYFFLKIFGSSYTGTH